MSIQWNYKLRGAYLFPDTHIYNSIVTHHPLKKHSKSFARRTFIIIRNAIDTLSCDLLSNSYLCVSNNSHGNEYQKQAAKNEVTDVPDGFKEWVTDHVEAQKGWASTPYFIKDNFVDGQLGKGLKIAMPTTHEIQSSLMADVAARLETMRKRRKEIKQQAQNIATTTISLSMFNTSIQISKGAVKEWLNQPHKFMLEKNELILDINKTLKQSKYVGWVKDKHNPNAKAHLFEIKINGEKSWIIVREFEDGTVCLHSITDSDKLAVMAKK